MSYKNYLLHGLWDAIVLLTTLYAAIIIPIELAFETRLVAFTLSEWLITLVFLLDFIVKFRKFDLKTRYEEFQEFEERSSTQAVLLFADILATIPLAFFFPAPLFRLFRLFKLVRIYFVIKSYHHIIIKYAGFLTFFSFVYWIIIIVNSLACGWHNLGISPLKPDLGTNYINSIYWTITTLSAVGYGDIIPVSNIQKIYAIFVEVLGFGVFTFLIGTVASRLMRKDPATVRYKENMDSLAALMHYRSLPIDLKERITNYYQYIWRKRLGYDETAFLKTLPDGLQIEVALHLKNEVIEKVSLFNNASDELKREIALLLKPIFLMPGDYVFKAGDIGNQMYFVVKGELDTLTYNEDQVLTKLKTGDFFGEIALFKNQDRSATIKAISYCDIYSLDKSSFNKVMERYPEISKKIKETVEQRVNKYSI